MVNYTDILKCDVFIPSFTTRQHCTTYRQSVTSHDHSTLRGSFIRFQWESKG